MMEPALDHLYGRGFELTKGWLWRAPPGYTPDEADLSAIEFLVQEWDFGGLA